MAHFAGLVAGGAHPSPVPHCHVVTTTTHKTLRGPRAGLILSRQEHAAAIDKVVFPGMQGGPLVHIIAAKAICFHEALQPNFTTTRDKLSLTRRCWRRRSPTKGSTSSLAAPTRISCWWMFSPRACSGSEAERALHDVASL